LDLAKCQSGQSRGRETLSKRGNARLRMAFWMAAQRAVRMTENSFRDKYERYTKQGPGNPDVRRKALTAVAAKMARVLGPAGRTPAEKLAALRPPAAA
jgi:transposase